MRALGWSVTALGLLWLVASGCPPAMAVPPSGDPQVPAGAQYVPPYPGSGNRMPPDIVAKERMWQRRAFGMGRARAQAAPAIGTVKVPVIMIDYTDQLGQENGDLYRNILFSVGTYPTGSMTDFYKANSYDQFTLTGDVWPASGWYHGDQTRANYAADVPALITKAIQLADPDVDFSQYDNDGDGWVDAMFIIHSGQGMDASGDPNDIWSHASSIPPVLVDGVWVSRYCIMPEYTYALHDSTMGVFTHEAGHAVLGLPDLYDYGYDARGVGAWDIMSFGSWNGGGATPANNCAWEKIALGWEAPAAVSGGGVYQVRPAETFPDVVQMPAASGPSSQYFLIENRQPIGNDQFIPGSGVLIWHCDDAAPNNDNQWYPGLPEGTHLLVALEQADGRWDLEHNANDGDATDPFGNGKNAFTATTTPDSRGYLQPQAVQDLISIGKVGQDYVLNFGGSLDLCVTVMDMIVAPTALGNQITAAIIVKNQGLVNIGPFDIAFFKDRATAPLNGTGADQTWHITSLAAGAETPRLLYQYVTTQAGALRAWVLADSGGVIPEDNEANNVASSRYTVATGPELMVSLVSVSPDPSVLGTPVTAQVKVKNVGTADAAGTFTVGLWRQRDTAPTDATGADETWDVSGLAAGAESSAHTFTFTPTTGGKFRGWAMVDTGKAVAELSEANNTRAVNYTVDAPDLVVSRLEVSPSPATLGQDLVATVQVKNVGTLGAGPFALTLWRNRPGAPTDGSGADASWSVAGLAAGAETSAFTWTFKPSAVGSYTGWAYADSAHAVSEGLETNNTSSATYPVQLRAVRGRVVLDGNGLPGVTITAGAKTATTDTGGYYALTDLSAGGITLVPALSGMGFSPRTLALTVGAADIETANFTAYHALSHVFSRPGLVLFASPTDPVGRTVTDLFGTPGLVAHSWAADTSSYTQTAGALQQAVGYWTRIPAGGATASTAGPTVAGGEYRLSVVPGWNLLGNPFAGKVDWTATEVEIDGARMALSGAVAQGWISSYAWVYGPDTGYVLIHATVPTARTQIATWEGFFLQAFRPLTLVLHQAASSAAAMDAPPKTVPATVASGFAFSVSARTDRASDAWNVVGVVPDGAAGAAPMTVAEPPGIGSGVTLSLLPPGSGTPSAVDLRSASGTNWRWEAVVRGGTAGERVTVGCDDLRALPRAYDAVLTDLQTGKSISLRSTPGMSFVVGRPDEERRFVLVVRLCTTGLRVIGLTGDSAARGGASIAYALSAPARVTITVLNAAGRVVGEMASDEEELAGAQTRYWTGRSLNGSMLPAGRYSVRVIAESATGERTSATTHVTLGGGM